MTLTYKPGVGMLAIYPGFTAVLGEHMTVAAIAKHIKELNELTQEN